MRLPKVVEDLKCDKCQKLISEASECVEEVCPQKLQPVTNVQVFFFCLLFAFGAGKSEPFNRFHKKDRTRGANTSASLGIHYFRGIYF